MPMFLLRLPTFCLKKEWLLILFLNILSEFLFRWHPIFYVLVVWTSYFCMLGHSSVVVDCRVEYPPRQR